MLNAKRWLAMLLAISLLFNLIPMNVLAEESADISAESAQVESTAAQNLVSSPEGDDETEPSDPTETSEPTEMSEPSESSEPSEPTETSEPFEPVETSEPSQPTETSEPSEPSESTEPTETTGVEDPTVANAPEGEEESDEMPVALSFTDAFADSFAGILEDANYSSAQIAQIITPDGNSITLHVSDGKILALLSQQTQAEGSNYQNWTISLEVTGGISLDDTFQGLGSVDFPFQGTFSGSSPWIKTKHTLFKHLSSEATLAEISLKWAGSQSEAIFAESLSLKKDYTIPMPLSFESGDKGAFSPFLGTVTGAFTATLPTLDYANADPQSVVSANTDLGLLCRQIGGGASLQVNSLTLPGGKLQFSTTANTGGLVGSMGEGSTLIISQAMALNLLLIGNNAGGLVGKMDTGAVIEFQNDAGVDVTAALKATNAGGIAGEVTTQTAPITPYSAPSGQANDAPPQNVRIRSVKANGEVNAGILYGNCTVTGLFDPFYGVTFTDGAVREVSGTGNCGGVFGTLTIEGTGTCSISADTGSTLKLNNDEIADSHSTGNNTRYGGIAGTLSDGARQNPLVVDRCSIKSTVSVGTQPGNYPQYIGGIVAVQGAYTTVDAKNSTVTISQPRTPLSTYGIGGLCAEVGNGALLMADKMTIVIDAFVDNQGSSGVAASTGRGAVVYLKNSLDLSNCLLSTCAYSGQIVGKQESSLIYAPGVAITRLDATVDGKLVQGMELDDIGNYGELYRLPDFLTIDPVTYAHTLPSISSCTLSTPTDYACLALAWQSRGYFPTVIDIGIGNWSDLKSSIIQLGGNIDMTGCGIGGLTRDVYSAEDTFTGTFNGGGFTLTLDIGKENQVNDPKVSKGDGRIYWHNATGLFAALGTGANVSGLTLAGSIRLSNNKITQMRSGALAAYASGSVTISGVSTQVAFDAICNGANVLYLGGLVGLISGTDSTALRLETGTKLAATFALTHSGNGAYNHIGGAVGGIDSQAGITLTCNGTTLSGKIESTGNVNNLYAGGLVGTIVPASGSTRTITLSDLKVDGFSLTGKASERMGGILGGIWADTGVTVSGLTVSNPTLTANGAAELGGLVYRASGKWTVNSVDLSGLTISAGSAKALGLLVCHGEPYKEPVNATTLNTNVDGLYLEMAEHWNWNANTKKGYNVPSNVTFDGGVFDEFVAYTAYADRSSNTPNYQITANGSGIISLKTDNGTVNMTPGDRNTYVNRTTVGQSKQTNLYSRYYYNLPTVKAACKDGDIDTPQEFLIWSVYRYAATNIQEYFTLENADITTDIIGGTSATSRASFDMDGLSYYPINITNANVTVQYADVKFYNSDIEAKEAGNKSTRGNAGSHSQHYTMHCALFLNFTAENITETKDYTMTVNGVTFAGTVGVVSGGSGALVCGKVAGEATGGNTSICTVVLADKDMEGKAVSLNGLSVAPEGDYTPALINTIGSYAGLKANYVTTTVQQTEIAGSSLIGDVGGQGATGVSIAFAGTIKLSENGVFSKATLLNSLRYNSGSATYNFYKSKDYTGETYVHNATHGKELSTTVEYAGKQGCYYDKYGEGYYVSQNQSFDSQNNFNTYLPYVAFSPATGDDTHTLASGWHEIAVNVLSDDVTDGCGTYGHPYKVNGNLFSQVADYINTGRASDGWQVRISTDDVYHTDEPGHDVLLTYTSGGWKAEETPYTDEYVRKYLQSAYYVITEDIELSNFNGIGSDMNWAFTGVIKGQQQGAEKWPTVKLSGGSTAFIQYSYGCVVRDLNIVLNQSPILSRPAWSRGTPEQAPGTFFGGVIGCVLGGDSIIDNVTVGKGTGSNNINPTGTNSHLVPVGGYVGVIAGGGVIFRGNYSNDTSITGTDAQLYRNPIIGRVLGGYAFYEGTGTAPNNTDKNYTINTLSGSNHLSWNGSTLTVNDEQGLLLLSAIVSSGAGSTQSNAYKNGVARNAKYDKVGQESEPDDYSIAQKDAGDVWQNGNTPYLLAEYASYTGSVPICTGTDDGIDILFKKDATFNMDGYGNGYRGLSARYVSNAAFVEKDGKNDVDASAVVMRVKTFDGQNANVQNIDMDVKEYNDDDFHMASMGGIFNIVWTQKQSGGGGDGSNFAQNLTLTNCNVSLKYVNSSGAEQTEAHSDTFSNEDGRRAVSVGGFIGMANDVEATQGSINHNYLFTNIHIKGTADDARCSIYGPNSVGGLIGSTAMASKGVKGYPGKLLANEKWALFGPSFLNCSYDNINVSGGLAAGGLIGDAYASGESTVPNFSGLGISYSSGSFGSYTSCTVTEKTPIVGQNSTITARAKGSIAGGLFGGAGMRVGVNDPEVNTKSGITIASENAISPLLLQNVSISVSTTDYDPGSVDRPDSNINNAYAAGIIGRIGSVNPSCFYNIRINGGGVTSTKATASRVGGIQGSGYTNSAITMERCEISSYTLSGANTGGFLGNGQNYDLFKFYMSDCKLTDSSVSGTSTAGGLVGNAQSYYYLYNILIKNTSITKNGNSSGAGRLFGNVETGKGYIYASGISVYSDPNHTPNCSVPGTDVGSGSITAGYIAYADYADYAGTETAVTDGKSPYVTVNPNFTLPGVNKTLYGDAVGKIDGDTYNSVAARIWADQKTGAAGKKNLVSYQNVTSIADGNSVPEVLSFQSFQKYEESESTYTNFPVLVIKGGDASPILNYLNVITNGGYKIAKDNASDYVTVEEPKAYYYDKVKDEFQEATEDDAPASIIKNTANTFEVKTGSYDNTRDRFTLLEFKFKTTVNGTNKYYTVSIPVVVERELQYDFMATFTPGTVFQKDFYSNLENHILESSGTPITAYLTYRYNRHQNSYVEYDWQSYLTEDGFDMLIGSQAMDKTLTFDGNLPKDTQLILIDCQNGNQAYQYKVAADIKTVNLSEFTSVCNDKVGFRPSLGVVLGIVAKEDSATGKFVRTTDSPNAILLGDGHSYRLATDKDNATVTRYTLTVPNLEENTAEENYYLVVTVPATDDPTYKLNGNLSSALTWGVPNSGTQVHRYDPTKADGRSQTESTYQISSGYQQSLTASPEEITTKDVASVSTPLTIDLLDTISFDKAQLYTENDKLYLKFSASLMSCLVDNDQKITSKLVQFPVGTTGTVHFYVQDESGNYYSPNGTGWVSHGTTPTPIRYNWESNGASIELPLSTDGRTALDLSGVRTAVKGQESSGIGKILVTAKMDVYFGSENILEDTIPASANGTDAYAQLHYVSRISTLEHSLATSTVRATEDDKVKYYRAVQTNASLSMDASNIDQLGVNPLQLVAEYQQTLNGKNASRIDLAVTLDLITPEKAQAFLKNTETLHFSLNLYRRNGEQNGEKYFEPIPDADALLAVKWSEAGAAGPFDWSYNIPRSSFIGDDVDPMLFNGTMFTIPLTAYVYTAPTDFANYKLEVSVSFLGADENEVDDLPIKDDKDAYVVYTYACIKPSFYEPSDSTGGTTTP